MRDKNQHLLSEFEEFLINKRNVELLKFRSFATRPFDSHILLSDIDRILILIEEFKEGKK